MISWHRLFGLALMDLFTDTGYTVELEKDLSLKQQFLDVIIIETDRPISLPELPDGLENVGKHNLLTYKSRHEALDGWTLDELTGHYVNYRKQISPAMDQLVPVEEFRLYGVCTRFPQKLHQQTPLQNRQPGVYEIQWGSQMMRVIVLSEIPTTPRNALWDLFSDVPSNVHYGAKQYHWHRTDRSTITNQLYARYAAEGRIMPYTFEDYHHDLLDEYLAEHKDEFLQRLSPEERLKGLSPDEILKRLSPDEILKRLSPDEILKRLSPDEIEAYLRKIRQHDLN